MDSTEIYFLREGKGRNFVVDILSREKRSWNMSRITSRDTKPEVLVRSYLFRCGFRFRKNDKRLPGTPDIVLPKYHVVIFVNGCFWHHHRDCHLAYVPKTRTDFWLKKFQCNEVNDKLHRDALEQMGWKVITVWECELKEHFELVMQRIVSILQKGS